MDSEVQEVVVALLEPSAFRFLFFGECVFWLKKQQKAKKVKHPIVFTRDARKKLESDFQ